MKGTHKYTYKDYLTWPDDERWELIDGTPYNMSPAPSRKHQQILGELFRQISNFLVGKPCRAFVAPFDVRLPMGNENDDETENVVQPDITVVCDSWKLDERGCKGAPSLVVEVLSPATAKKDLNEKRELYEKAGVKEYWIVDPNNETVVVYGLDEGGRYSIYEVYSKVDVLKVGLFEGLKIGLSGVFGEV